MRGTALAWTAAWHSPIVFAQVGSRGPLPGRPTEADPLGDET